MFTNSYFSTQSDATPITNQKRYHLPFNRRLLELAAFNLKIEKNNYRPNARPTNGFHNRQLFLERNRSSNRRHFYRLQLVDIQKNTLPLTKKNKGSDAQPVRRRQLTTMDPCVGELMVRVR
jgi:hypothetical protein